MRRFNDWLNRNRKLLEYLSADDESAFRVRVDADKALRVHAPPSWRDASQSIDQTLTNWCLRGMYRDGVKAFCPTAAEVELMGRAAVTVPWTDYHQPFPTFVVVFPDGYRDDSYPTGFDPIATACRFGAARDVIILATLGRDRNALGYRLILDPGESVEESFFSIERRHPLPPGCDLLPLDAGAKTRRVVLNAALFLAHYGARKVGGVNPEYAARLRRTAANPNAPAGARREAEAALRLMPVVYAVDQNIFELGRRERGDREAGPPTGRRTGPHWRRGHDALQPHGPAGSLRKVVHRPAVFVNLDLFGGDLADTSYTVRTPPGDP